MNIIAYDIFKIIALFILGIVAWYLIDWVWYKLFVEEGKPIKLE